MELMLPRRLRNSLLVGERAPCLSTARHGIQQMPCFPLFARYRPPIVDNLRKLPDWHTIKHTQIQVFRTPLILLLRNLNSE